MRRSDAFRDGERQLVDELAEVQARAGGVHAALTVEGEQRRIGRAGASCSSTVELASQELTDARPMRNQTTLAELAAPHDQQLPVGVDVTEPEAADLSGSQSEAVAEGEDGVVGRPATSGSRVVGQGRGRLDQLAGLGGVEQERQSLGGLPAPGGA
jgi:hypothetical protein